MTDKTIFSQSIAINSPPFFTFDKLSKFVTDINI